MSTETSEFVQGLERPVVKVLSDGILGSVVKLCILVLTCDFVTPPIDTAACCLLATSLDRSLNLSGLLFTLQQKGRMSPAAEDCGGESVSQCS